MNIGNLVVLNRIFLELINISLEIQKEGTELHVYYIRKELLSSSSYIYS